MNRQAIEEIVVAALTAGYSIGVSDGNKTSIEHSRDKSAILAKVLSASEDWLLVYRKGRAFGYFRFVSGALRDYTSNLSPVLRAARDAHPPA